MMYIVSLTGGRACNPRRVSVSIRRNKTLIRKKKRFELFAFFYLLPTSALLLFVQGLGEAIFHVGVESDFYY